MTTQPWPLATMVTWGRHAAGRRFHRRGAHHPSQPSFTTNAAFGDLWTMQPSPGGLTQEPLLSPWLFLVATAFFFFDQWT